MPSPLLALLDSGWDWGSVRVPPLTYELSQASPRTLVPLVYVAKRSPTIYHSVQSCGHASRVKDLLAISLTVAMAGWWRPPRGRAAGMHIEPLRPCLDCHKHIYAMYWKAFDIEEHPWAVDLWAGKRRRLSNDDSSADSDDSSYTSSSDVITVVRTPDIELVDEDIDEDNEDSDNSPMVLDDDHADLQTSASIQEASNQGQDSLQTS